MRRLFVTLIAVALILQGLSAQADSSATKVRFAYDLDFEMRFDNREYRAFDRSMTIFGARLTPAVGMDVNHGNSTVHRIMAGIDIMKDFGASPVTWGAGSNESNQRLNNWDLFKEISLYYRLQSRIGRTDLTVTAGVFPRRFSNAEWPSFFFSDAVKFYDNNLEGLLLTFKRPKAYYEAGCDWMGQYGKARREAFMIFSDGRASILPLMGVGYYAYLYHFACSEEVRGVVDNAILNPYIYLDLAGITGMQLLGATIGYVGAYQNDRANIGRPVFPMGGELVIDARKWNVGLQYRLFYGKDMMPYYYFKDAGDIMYGDRLYFGEPFYRIHEDGDRVGAYQRIELYYEPHIADFVKLDVRLKLHVNGGFSGWQQIVGVSFNLETLMKKVLH